MWLKYAAGALALLNIVSSPAFGYPLGDRALCRLSFGNTVRQRVAVITVQMGLCHRDRLLGRIPDSVSCSDPATWAASNYEAGVAALARQLARMQAQSRQCSARVETTAEIGHTGCPAPCEALPTTTFPELGACMECLIQASALTSMPPTLGSPPLPATKAARICEQNIARGMVIYMNKRMKLQHDCQFLKEINDPEYAGVDCADLNQPTHPYYARAQRAVDKLRLQITGRCEAVMLATELDTCGADVAAESSCVLAAADQWTDTMMAALYPPF